MNKSNALAKELPDIETIIEIDLEGKLTKRKYKGEFRFRIPNLKERAQSDVFRAKLNGGLKEDSLDPTIANLHYQISYLKFTLVETPKWWADSESGYTLHDYNVVNDVYTKCLAYEEVWMAQVWGPKDGDKDGEPKGA